MGGGAAPQMMEEAAALEMPAAAAPEMEALPTASADIAPMAKESGQEVESAPLTQPEANPPAAPIPVSWQALLLAVGFISAAVMFVLREQAKRTWR
jgi:tryptophan-rich sensory protein